MRTRGHYSFLMSQKSSCFAAAWDLAGCPHSQYLFRYVLLMKTKFSCLAAAWDLADHPHFHYIPSDLLHHQAGDRQGKVSNFRWLRDRTIGSGILSSSDLWCSEHQCQLLSLLLSACLQQEYTEEAVVTFCFLQMSAAYVFGGQNKSWTNNSLPSSSRSAQLFLSFRHILL